MASHMVNARSATLIVTSPLRHATGALAVSAGFAYVLEAEDQFHRSVWFGVMFAGLTGAWFILGSFLALIDTVAVWWTAVTLVVLAWGSGASGSPLSRPARSTTPGAWTSLDHASRLLAVLVGASAGLTLSIRGRRWPGWLVRHSAAAGALVWSPGWPRPPASQWHRPSPRPATARPAPRPPPPWHPAPRKPTTRSPLVNRAEPSDRSVDDPAGPQRLHDPRRHRSAFSVSHPGPRR